MAGAADTVVAVVAVVVAVVAAVVAAVGGGVNADAGGPPALCSPLHGCGEEGWCGGVTVRYAASSAAHFPPAHFPPAHRFLRPGARSQHQQRSSPSLVSAPHPCSTNPRSSGKCSTARCPAWRMLAAGSLAASALADMLAAVLASVQRQKQAERWRRAAAWRVRVGAWRVRCCCSGRNAGWWDGGDGRRVVRRWAKWSARLVESVTPRRMWRQLLKAIECKGVERRGTQRRWWMGWLWLTRHVPRHVPLHMRLPQRSQGCRGTSYSSGLAVIGWWREGWWLDYRASRSGAREGELLGRAGGARERKWRRRDDVRHVAAVSSPVRAVGEAAMGEGACEREQSIVARSFFGCVNACSEPAHARLARASR